MNLSESVILVYSVAYLNLISQTTSSQSVCIGKAINWLLWGGDYSRDVKYMVKLHRVELAVIEK